MRNKKNRAAAASTVRGVSVSAAEIDKARGALFVDRHANAIAYGLVAFTALMALLLFNTRLDEGGDDSGYICRALDLVADGTYPTFQNPLYPIFLAPFIAMAGGANLLVLKLTSLFLVAGSQLVMWLSLRRSVSHRLLLGVMALMSVNQWSLSFGSLTYSEPLFTVLMWAAVGFALRLDAMESASASWRKMALWAGLAGLFIVLAYLVRTVGLGLAIGIVAYLALRRKWAHVGAIAVSCALWLGVWTGIRAAAWGEVNSGGQMQTLLQVDPYDPSDGLEDFSGYVGRFIGNSELYISKHYVKMFGFRHPDSRETSAAITLFLYILWGWGAWCAWKRNRGVLLMAVLSATMLGITFFSLQTMWDQCRLIIPYVGLMHIVILFGVADLVRRINCAKAAKVMTVAIAIAAGVLFLRSAGKVDFKTLSKNLGDDPLYGYTPDWYNYLTVCREVGAQLSGDEYYVACRKPMMARIVSGGKRFHGVYNIPSEDADVLVKNLKDNGVTHIIVASLRRDPAQAGLGVINTVHRYLERILNKYPYFLTLSGQMGDTDNEPAALYRINYENAVPPADAVTGAEMGAEQTTESATSAATAAKDAQ